MDKIFENWDKIKEALRIEHDLSDVSYKTCTGLNDFVNHRFLINKIFRVTNGTVINEN